MALAAFDTLAFVEELEKAGISEKEARAISTAVRKSHESLDVATKADLEKLGMELRHEIGNLRKDMEAQFVNIDAKYEALRKDIEARFVGFEAKFVSFEAKFVSLESRLAGVESRLTGIESRLAGLETKCEVLRAEMTAIKWGIGLIASGIIALLVKTFF